MFAKGFAKIVLQASCVSRKANATVGVLVANRVTEEGEDGRAEFDVEMKDSVSSFSMF